MLPLTLLGLGAASVNDYANSRALLSDDAMLARQGLPENYRKDIIEAAQRGDTATAQRLLQEGFKQRDPAIAAQSQQEMDAETEKLDGTVMPDGSQNPNATATDSSSPAPADVLQPENTPKGPIHLTGDTKASVDYKLDTYLLNPDHPIGGPKSKWYREALGFTRENASELAGQLIFDPSTAIPTINTSHGQKYSQKIPIKGANGRTIEVTVI